MNIMWKFSVHKYD